MAKKIFNIIGYVIIGFLLFFLLFVTISNLSKKALPEIETEISTFMMREKQKYAKNKEI